MNTERLKLSEIIHRESPFNYQGFLFKERPPFGCPEGSTGVVPLLVYREDKGRVYLVDGFSRYEALKSDSDKEVDVVVIDPATSVNDLLCIRLYQDWEVVSATGANRLGFISFALKAGAERDWVVNWLCRILRLRPSEESLSDALRFMELSEELRAFFHKKSYSLKQVLNLLYYPVELLNTLGGWLSRLQLTASVFEEVAESLYDHIRASGLDIEAVLNSREIKAVLEGRNPGENTRRLRELIRRWRNPILTKKNERIERLIKDARLPEKIRVSWDRSLENRQVTMTVSFNKREDVRELMERLKGSGIRKCIEEIIEEL